MLMIADETMVTFDLQVNDGINYDLKRSLDIIAEPITMNVTTKMDLDVSSQIQ